MATTARALRTLWRIRRAELAAGGDRPPPRVDLYAADEIADLETNALVERIPSSATGDVELITTTDDGITLLEQALALAAAMGLRPHTDPDAVGHVLESAGSIADAHTAPLTMVAVDRYGIERPPS